MAETPIAPVVVASMTLPVTESSEPVRFAGSAKLPENVGRRRSVLASKSKYGMLNETTMLVGNLIGAIGVTIGGAFL